jgi:hypothetical protein
MQAKNKKKRFKTALDIEYILFFSPLIAYHYIFLLIYIQYKK